MSKKNNALYMNLVSDIYYNNEFDKTKSIEHHGTSRFDHSVRVSYYSYRIAKLLRLNYKETARAGLLHDFFLDTYGGSKFKLLYDHPNKAVENSKKYFDISAKEVDIIKTHMFPVNLVMPKYAESWIVSSVDKFVAIEENLIKFRYKIAYIANLYLIFLFNFMK